MYLFLTSLCLLPKMNTYLKNVELILNLPEQDHNVRKTPSRTLFCFPLFKVDHQSTYNLKNVYHVTHLQVKNSYKQFA